MQIKDILNLNNAYLYQGNENDFLTNLSIDTRTLKPNDTYIGIKGEVYDGSTFYKEAIKKGAKTLILNNIPLDTDFLKNKPLNIIIVDNTTTYLINLAKRKRATLNIPVIAVTGSVGKTSTKNIISEVLSTKYQVLKTSGNLNTSVGLSLTILSHTTEEIIVLEMGMNQKGEISLLTSIAKPTHAVITNIGTAHIGYLGSRENILKAKLEILEGLSGPIIINNDNDLLHKWAKENKDKYDIITFGLENPSNYLATNIMYDEKGSNFTYKNHAVSLNILGKHFIYNSLVAFIISDLFNLNNESVIKKLKELKPEPHRMELISCENYLVIDDSYNASYDSVYYNLEILKSFKGRKIAVLGDILELGEYGPKIHEDIGHLIYQNNLDLLITIGNLSSNINKIAIQDGFNKNNSFHFNSNEEAIKYINNIKKKNDVFLIKASHGMGFSDIIKNII